MIVVARARHRQHPAAFGGNEIELLGQVVEVVEEVDEFLRRVFDGVDALCQRLFEHRTALFVSDAFERVDDADHVLVALPEVVVAQAGEFVGFDLFVDVDPLPEHDLAHAAPLVGEMVAARRDGPQRPIGVVAAVEVDVGEDDLGTLAGHSHAATQPG